MQASTQWSSASALANSSADSPNLMLILECHPERSRSIRISKIENYCEGCPTEGCPTLLALFARGWAPRTFRASGRNGQDRLGFRIRITKLARASHDDHSSSVNRILFERDQSFVGLIERKRGHLRPKADLAS